MPIYEYHCKHCGKTEEVLQKTAKSRQVTCPSCKKPMEKRFSSFSVGINQPGTASKCISCTDRGCPHANGH